MRVSGKDFDITLGDLAVHVEKSTLDIEDSSTVASDRGTPNGSVAGAVKGSGSIDLDAQMVSILTEAALSAGSWQDLPPFDMLFYAETNTGERKKVEAFGCKLRISKLLDVDHAGGSKDITTFEFDVTSPDFVRINGVPYLSPKWTQHIISDVN